MSRTRKLWDRPTPPAMCECGHPITSHRDLRHTATRSVVRMACPARDAVFTATKKAGTE